MRVRRSKESLAATFRRTRSTPSFRVHALPNFRDLPLTNSKDSYPAEGVHQLPADGQEASSLVALVEPAGASLGGNQTLTPPSEAR